MAILPRAHGPQTALVVAQTALRQPCRSGGARNAAGFRSFRPAVQTRWTIAGRFVILRFAQRDRDMMAGKKLKKQSVTTHLNLAARAARTALSQRLALLDLYSGQDAVLIAIGEDDGISLRDLAEQLSVRPPTITKTVNRLAAQGLVTKQLSTHDGRRSHAHLTEAGLAIVDGVLASRKTVERSALKGFSDKERKALRKMLVRMAANLSGTIEVPADGVVADLEDDD